MVIEKSLIHLSLELTIFKNPIILETTGSKQDSLTNHLGPHITHHSELISISITTIS